VKLLLDEKELKDRRSSLNFALGNWETGKVFNYLNKDGYFYIGEKFWCPGILSNYDSNNYKIFRYADALLMMAECWHQLGEDQRARDYLDVVRLRAGLPRVEALTGPDLMDQIICERAKELFEKEDEESSVDFDAEKYKKDEASNAINETWLPISTRYYLFLSGTPFRAINNGEFIEEQIFNWTYSDEQRAKAEWKGS
jgi:hypothetical protein